MKLRQLLAHVPRDAQNRPDWVRFLRRQAVQQLVLVFRVVSRLLPTAWDEATARGAVRAFEIVAPRHVVRMYENLRLVYGQRLTASERRGLADRSLLCHARSLTEFMHMPSLSPDDVRRRVEIRGKVHIERARAAGKGVILATGHYGNFEMMAACCGAFGLSLTAIARPRDDDFTEQFVDATRAQHRVTVISKTAWRQALRALKANQAVGILADQAVLVGGVMADFLGLPASTAIGPLILAKASGAPVLPCFVTREPNHRFRIDLHAPLALPDTGDQQADLEAGARLLNDAISAQIRHRPEEWLWMHRRWKAPLSTRREAPRLSRSTDLAAGK